MPYARTSDGFKLYYEEHGTSGSPLVLAYGIGGNTEMWDVNVAALSARHRLILWEPRGHARSDSPEDPARVSFPRWALDLRDVLEHRERERANWEFFEKIPPMGRTEVKLASVKGSQLIVYAGAPHGLMFTHLDRLHRDLLGFIGA